MAEYIEIGQLWNCETCYHNGPDGCRLGLFGCDSGESYRPAYSKLKKADVAPVVHGRWILEAHDERVNYRWNVTAECSECCDERKEIWAGFFPGVPPSIARGAALVSAESVKLSNHCPNCGAKMDGGAE